MQTTDQQIAALKRGAATLHAEGEHERADAAEAKLAKLRGDDVPAAPSAPVDATPAKGRTQRATQPKR